MPPHTSLSAELLAEIITTLEHGTPQAQEALALRLSAHAVVSAPPTFPRLHTGGLDSPLIAHLSPLIRAARELDVLAAFVMPSGVWLIRDVLRQALDAGATCRILSGDYLCRTHPRALADLLDLSDALRATDKETAGSLDVRMIEMDLLPATIPSFHPKAWRILTTQGTHRAFVGSSNLSRAALRHGVEWNMWLDAHEDPSGMFAIKDAFETLWHQATRVTQDWLTAYSARHAAQLATQPAHIPNEARIAPTPRPHQQEALAALHAHRALNTPASQRALLVMATGVGKTWTAMFDIAQIEQRSGKLQRVLWIAHRAELLTQAADTYRACFPTHRIHHASRKEPVVPTPGSLTVASIQRLSRPHDLAQLSPDAFDILIIDEVHHALAPSYLRVIQHLTPHFLLGLTATPHRGDDQHLETLLGPPVYSVWPGEAIARGALVPFIYQGLCDPVNYEELPWRTGSFDPDALDRMVMAETRQEFIWEAWQAHEGTRTLLFCCSIAHADHMGRWLLARGVRIAVLHSAPHSDDRALAIERLEAGDLDAICTVDLFNEGVDIPTVDRVIMARPTESRVIFLQQLGRGLRKAPGKTRLVVLDLVGNHHVFLDRFKALLDTFCTSITLRDVLAHRTLVDDITGCEIVLALETIELMRHFMVEAVDPGFISLYDALRRHQGGVRPRLIQLRDMGSSFERLRRRFGSWFHVVAEMGDLSEREREVRELTAPWFEHLEHTRHTIETLVNLEDEVCALDTLLELPATLRQLFGSPFGHHAISPELLTRGAEWCETWRDMAIEVLEYLSVQRTILTPSSTLDSRRAVANWGEQEATLTFEPRTSIMEELDLRLDGSIWRLRFIQGACTRARRVGCHEHNLEGWLEQLTESTAGSRVIDFIRHPDGWSARMPEERAQRALPESLLHSEDAMTMRVSEDGEAWILVREGRMLHTHTTLGFKGPPSLAHVTSAHLFFTTSEKEGSPRTWTTHGEATRARDAEIWDIDEVPYTLWKQYGQGRGSSRALPEHFGVYAIALLEAVSARLAQDTVYERDGKRCVVRKIDPRRGIFIDGGEHGFKGRQVSTLDVSWAMMARQEALVRGRARADERLVNELRYLPGTPSGSTRYIDTRWALYLLACFEEVMAH